MAATAASRAGGAQPALSRSAGVSISSNTPGSSTSTRRRPGCPSNRRAPSSAFNSASRGSRSARNPRDGRAVPDATAPPSAHVAAHPARPPCWRANPGHVRQRHQHRARRVGQGQQMPRRRRQAGPHALARRIRLDHPAIFRPQQRRQRRVARAHHGDDAVHGRPKPARAGHGHARALWQCQQLVGPALRGVARARPPPAGCRHSGTPGRVDTRDIRHNHQYSEYKPGQRHGPARSR